MMRKNNCLIPALLLASGTLLAAERPVDPTFLHRFLPDVPDQSADLTTPACHYKPLFGAGDKDTSIVKGVARYGEITVDRAGASAGVSYPREEQVYYIAQGQGALLYQDKKVPVHQGDFMYLPAGVKHGLAASSDGACKAIVMGFKLPAKAVVTIPSKVLLANIGEVKKQVVGNHPPSTLYQLMIGDERSTRDKIAAGHVLTSLFIMEFTPGGTNFPHHHEREEEIYLVLEGSGDMVAGGGATGVEGRYPAKAGDAYFFRLNCTVGFYNSEAASTKKARILAVRSLFPERVKGEN